MIKIDFNNKKTNFFQVASFVRKHNLDHSNILELAFQQETLMDDNKNLLFRGQYLVEVVGHCGTCHSPSTWFSIVKNKSDLSGRKDSFNKAKDGAPNITSMKKAGIGLWSKSDIIFYLLTGIKPDGDFANENMQSIIDEGTSHLSKKDLEAIAVYLLNNKKIKSATVE